MATVRLAPEYQNLANLPSHSREVFRGGVSSRPVDFSVQDPAKSWKEVAQKIALIVLKIVLFPWAIYEAAKYVVQRIAMIAVYPAQSRFIRMFVEAFSKSALDACRAQYANLGSKWVARHVVLERNGVRYSGLLLGTRSTIDNGKWALQATGNGEPIEYAARNIAEIYQEEEFNTLLVNGPGVGRSEGHATFESMGEVQETALSFLEAMGAKTIVIAGRSLGGAAISSAIERHTFRQDVRYYAVYQMTFGRLGDLVSEILPSLGKILRWCGLEMDSVRTSERLGVLGIHQVVVQSSDYGFSRYQFLRREDEIESDGPISAHSSLAETLRREQTPGWRTFVGVGRMEHMNNYSIASGCKEVARMERESAFSQASA